VPPIHGSCRSIEQPFREGAQVQSGASYENRKLAPASNLFEHFSGLALVIPGREDFRRLTNIDHVVGHAPPFFERRLGGANVEMPEDLDRVVIDDFAVKGLREKKGEL